MKRIFRCVVFITANLISSLVLAAGTTTVINPISSAMDNGYVTPFDCHFGGTVGGTAGNNGCRKGDTCSVSNCPPPLIKKGTTPVGTF